MNIDNPIKNSGLSGIIRNFSWVSQFFIVLFFLLIRLLLNNFMAVNEADVLPAAKQFIDSSWIPGDWYLNQDIGYRIFFNSFIGMLARFLSFQMVSLLGRIIVIVLWSFLITGFIHKMKVSVVFIIPLLWILIAEQSIIAGEWMIWALETKTFSYLFLMAAFLFLNQRKYLWAALFIGFSVSFHVLIGGYGTLCFIMLLLFERRHLQINFKVFVIAVLLYLISASIGLFAIYQNFSSPSDIDKVRAGLIYVNSRVPHHVLPSYWLQRGGLWKPLLKLIFSLTIIIFSALRPWNKFSRLFSRFALLSILFSISGFIIFAIGRDDLLKFYPFRLPDTLLPVSAYFLLFSFVSKPEFVYGKIITTRIKKISGIIISIIIIAFISVPFYNSKVKFSTDPDYYLSYLPLENSQRALYTWIKVNTKKDSLFLVPPGEERFYLSAERPQFVDFKHSPQSEVNILEWYRRLMLLSDKDSDPTGYTIDLDRIKTDYWQLSAEKLKNIAQEYNVDYYISHLRSDLAFKVIFSIGEWAVYDLGARVN